jgi:hypothetical protein
MLHIHHPKTARAHAEAVLLEITGDFFHVLLNSMFTNHTNTKSHINNKNKTPSTIKYCQSMQWRSRFYVPRREKSQGAEYEINYGP